MHKREEGRKKRRRMKRRRSRHCSWRGAEPLCFIGMTQICGKMRCFLQKEEKEEEEKGGITIEARRRSVYTCLILDESSMLRGQHFLSLLFSSVLSLSLTLSIDPSLPPSIPSFTAHVLPLSLHPSLSPSLPPSHSTSFSPSLSLILPFSLKPLFNSSCTTASCHCLFNKVQRYKGPPPQQCKLLLCPLTLETPCIHN